MSLHGLIPVYFFSPFSLLFYHHFLSPATEQRSSFMPGPHMAESQPGKLFPPLLWLHLANSFPPGLSFHITSFQQKSLGPLWLPPLQYLLSFLCYSLSMIYVRIWWCLPPPHTDCKHCDNERLHLNLIWSLFASLAQSLTLNKLTLSKGAYGIERSFYRWRS